MSIEIELIGVGRMGPGSARRRLVELREQGGGHEPASMARGS
jgi:hypothetical protein